MMTEKDLNTFGTLATESVTLTAVDLSEPS